MKFDAIVIGSGQAGNPLSYRLADHGWTVALIEQSHLGGTCVNTGCTPTKTMMHRAQVAHYARNAARWGVGTGRVSVDLAAIVAQKKKIVQNFRGGTQRQVARRAQLRLYRGHARFLGPHQIEVGKDRLESKKIFIDTGGRSNIPNIPGLDAVSYLTNESIMELTALPEHLMVLGGGYIGVEFGQMFRRFGSQVTVVHQSGQLLPREDAEVAAELQKALEAEGIRFLLNAGTTRVEQQGNQRAGKRAENRARKHDGAITLSYQTNDGPQASHSQKPSHGASSLTGSHLLVATGRRPNTDDLGLEAAGVKTDSRGYIKANHRLETSAPGIWALGDVKGGPAFTHISYNDFQIVYANLIERKNLTTMNRYVPYCVFTDPQLGGVGMTEREARAAGYKLKIGSIPMSQVARAIERDETAGLMKIVVNAANDRILGASILSTEGGELVQILGALILAKKPYTLLKGAVYIHPTLAEGFYALMESVKPVA